MEEKKKKCSYKEHKDIDAVSYCQDCKIYICNKCINYHGGLFENHSIYNLDNKEIFIEICKEKNHPNKLEFYCKNHNQLCCSSCITKIQVKGYGQHKDCEICIIEDIKEEKKNKLKDNIKYLEDLSNNLNNSIEELKSSFEKIEERKEILKTEIQNIFTKIRTILNDREDELLLDVDNKFNEIFGNEEIIKQSEKLPNKIKLSLEKGKIIDNDWNDNNKLRSIINNCINIEENIENIIMVNENIKKCKLNNNANIDFKIEDDYFNNFIKSIKSLGKLYEKCNLDSLILKNKEIFDKFKNLLSSQIKINNMNLLYRSSRDGLRFESLKNKINNNSNLIFLFLTGNTRIFGSFTKSKVEVKHDTYTKDEKAFVFSLNNNKIYKILMPEYALRYYEGYPIMIGNNYNGNGFWVESKTIRDEYVLKNPKIYDFQKKNELTGGQNELTEFEIFEINYNEINF